MRRPGRYSDMTEQTLHRRLRRAQRDMASACGHMGLLEAATEEARCCARELERRSEQLTLRIREGLRRAQ